jgi:hypothetical protein
VAADLFVGGREGSGGFLGIQYAQPGQFDGEHAFFLGADRERELGLY